VGVVNGCTIGGINGTVGVFGVLLVLERRRFETGSNSSSSVKNSSLEEWVILLLRVFLLALGLSVTADLLACSAALSSSFSFCFSRCRNLIPRDSRVIEKSGSSSS